MMINWLQGFLERYPEAMERRTVRPQMLDRVEEAVAKWRSLRRIERETLRAIEDSPAWDYPEWWPRLSKEFNATIEIPCDLSASSSHNLLIEKLYNLIQHIEVVSVVLRFVAPEEFGIMSPPVLSFLCLAPPPNDPSSISYYKQYLRVLADLRDHYELRRVADVDMALWSAAQLHLDRNQQALVDQMRADDYFWQLSLDNMLQGLDDPVRRLSARRHLLLAQVFLKHDYLLAALIAARAYEVILLELAKKWGIKVAAPTKRGQSPTGAQKDRIKRDPELKRLGIAADDIDTWWEWRNDAVHPDRQITQPNASKFIDAMLDFSVKARK